MTKGSERLPAVVLAATGLILSAVLEWVHVRTYLDVTAESFCTLGEQLDCNTVALSRFSVFLGVPLPTWGIIGFLTLMTAAWRRSVLLLPLSGFAALASVALLIEELVHVGAVCLLCEGVHLASWALLIAAWRMPDKQPFNRSDAVDILGIPAGLLVAARLLVPPYWVFALWTTDLPADTGITEDGHPWIGASEPELVVHEWVDYTCPHCAVASNRTRMAVANEADSLRVVRRHQPRMPCYDHVPASCLPLRAALCADEQDKFWQMDSWLFTHAPGKAVVELEPAVKALDLDAEAFDACLNAEATWSRATELSKEARKRKILETPTYTIDDEKISIRDVSERIDAL